MDKIQTLSKNLNWLVVNQIKKISEPRISNTKWRKLSNQEKDRIKEEQKIDNEIFKRNGQIILSDIIIAKTKDKRFTSTIEQSEFKYDEQYNKFVNTKNRQIEEAGYQRAQDKTYNIAFKEEMDVESKQYEPQVKWHNGESFIKWYNKPIEERYKQGEFRRPSDKLHILDENNLSY